jgi:thiol:disulfide interchange protein DsbC
MNKRIIALLLCLALFQLTPVYAADDSGKLIRAAIGKILPGIPVDEITPSPMAGISEVIIGSKLFYVSNDGKYLMQGSLIDLATRNNLSEDRLKSVRLGVMEGITQADMIVFPAREQRHVVSVFTDIDCGYCRKLHSEIDQYNNLGITVQYLMYPRSGLEGASYDKAVSVWCNEDRPKALTRAKAGESLPSAGCSNPVSTHYNLGQQMGIRGTPAILLENGELLPGYLPASKLAIELDKRS